MIQRRSSRPAATTRAARERDLPRRASPPAPAKDEAGEGPAQVRAPNKLEWLDPLDEEELAALKAAWGFLE